MYSHWENSRVNSSGVAGNHRSWKIYLSQKLGTTNRLSLKQNFRFTHTHMEYNSGMQSPMNTENCVLKL